MTETKNLPEATLDEVRSLAFVAAVEGESLSRDVWLRADDFSRAMQEGFLAGLMAADAAAAPTRIAPLPPTTIHAFGT